MGVGSSVAGDYDRWMRPLERLLVGQLRRSIFPQLRGRVLELGVGTGVNLPLYESGVRVIAIDRSPEMLSRAAGRQSQASVSLVEADVHRLPFVDSAFDTVSGALVFCSIASPDMGLKEARRVLHAAGRLALVEHTRGSGLGSALTGALQPLWGIWSRECRLDRETVRAVASAGFRPGRVEQHALGIFRTIVARASE